MGRLSYTKHEYFFPAFSWALCQREVAFLFLTEKLQSTLQSNISRKIGNTRLLEMKLISFQSYLFLSQVNLAMYSTLDV